MTSFAVVGVDWSQGIDDAWSNVATFLPKLIGFLIVLVVGWIVAKIVARVCRRLLDRVGFDNVVERGGIKQALANSNYDASELAGKFIYYGLLLLVLQAAFGVFGTNPVSDVLNSIVAYLPKLIAAIVLVIVVAAIANVVRELVTASLGGLSYGKALGVAAYVAIITIGVFAALNQLRIATDIVNGLFYAMLAIVAGSAIVAIGGGGIQPMRQRWENALRKYDEEKPRVQQHMQTSRDERLQARGSADLSRSEAEERTPYTPQQ
jgi:hypothetical protein